MSDVGDFCRIGDARGLDAQDRDLIEHFAGAHRNQDFFHVSFLLVAMRRMEANSSSSFAVTASTVMSSMTPGNSIFWVHGSRAADLPRNLWAASSYASTHQRREK